MNSFRLEDMTKGWFVGDFLPAAYCSKDVEVGVKSYSQGECEQKHYHKIATELTVIVSGEVTMFGRRWGPGDIVVISPGEATSFEALTDVVTVVVKLPSAANDKFKGSFNKL